MSHLLTVLLLTIALTAQAGSKRAKELRVKTHMNPLSEFKTFTVIEEAFQRVFDRNVKKPVRNASRAADTLAREDEDFEQRTLQLIEEETERASREKLAIMSSRNPVRDVASNDDLSTENIVLPTTPPVKHEPKNERAPDNWASLAIPLIPLSAPRELPKFSRGKHQFRVEE